MNICCTHLRNGGWLLLQVFLFHPFSRTTSCTVKAFTDKRKRGFGPYLPGQQSTSQSLDIPPLSPTFGSCVNHNSPSLTRAYSASETTISLNVHLLPPSPVGVAQLCSTVRVPSRRLFPLVVRNAMVSCLIVAATGCSSATATASIVSCTLATTAAFATATIPTST